MKKRLLCSLLCLAVLLAAFQGAAFASEGDGMNDFLFPVEDYGIDMSVTKKTEEINIRDPFVVVYGQTYFMYGTGAARGAGYGCYVSRDLENWAGPVNVFTAPAGYDGNGCFWAPECHYYNGSFYLFATYLSTSTGHRGVSIFKADTPLGEFVEITNGHITPHDFDAIDGTLYVDNQGQPWMVYIDEWTTAPNGNGGINCAKLSDDLTHFTSEPRLLFRARDASWSRSGVTDGPFMYELDGKLLMLWSTSDVGGYCVGFAESSDGTLEGDWTILKDRLYSKTLADNKYDGGHAMIFTGLDGKLYTALHSPNSNKGGTEFEKALFLETVESDGVLVLQSTLDYNQNRLDSFLHTFLSIIEFLTAAFGIITAIGRANIE